MKITVFFLLLAVATASQLDSSDSQTDDKIDPIQDQQTPTEDKFYNKRTLFRLKPVVYRKKHVRIHPLGFRYVLGYSPLKHRYVLRRPQVTLLKPVVHHGGWKPVKPVVPVVPVKPVKPIIPVKPAVVAPAPIIPSGSGQDSILLPPHPEVFKPFVPAVAPTVLKPVLPGVIPQFVPQVPLVNPQVPAVYPQIHPFLRPLLNQFLLNLQPGLVQHGNHLDVLKPGQQVGLQIFVPPAVPPHHTRLDIVNKLVPVNQPVVPHGNHLDVVKPVLPYPQTLLQHGNHFDAINPALVPQVIPQEGLVLHGNHLDVVKPVLTQALYPHGNHFDAVQPAVVPQVLPQEGLVHHGNHFDLLRPLQPAVPHDNHLDLLPFKPLPNIVHQEQHLTQLKQPQEHLHLESHIHPEQPNVVHTEAHLHHDGLVPHVHQIQPQLPLYLPEHPNYKPGFSSSVQEEHSGTFPRYPLLQQK